MSLLQVVQNACRHPSLTLPAPASVIGNETGNVPAMLMAAKEELDALATRHTWQKLTKENTFTTIAAAAQTTASAVPADFDRMLNGSIYNRTRNRSIWGPLDADQWQSIQSSLVTMVDPGYRFRGGTILLTPTPDAGDTVAYEYISTYKVRSAGGTEQVTWAADDDTSVFPWPLVTLGVVWRYRRGKGYVYSAEEEAYERRVTELIMRDGSKPRLTSEGPRGVTRPHPPAMPETLVGL